MSRTTWIARCAVLLALLLFAAACASGDDAGSTDTATEQDGATEEEAAAADDGAGELTPVNLTLNWVPYGEHAPFYYGLAQGFYEDEGIRLTIQPGSGSGATAQATGAGQTDFGWVDTPALLNAVSSGVPAKSVGVYLQTTPASVEFFADSGISEPQDLVGITIGGTAGDAMSQTFPAFLAANDLSESDVTVQNVDPAGKIAALVEGRVDAIMGFFHDQAPTIANLSGKEVDVLRFSEWGVNFLGTGLVTNESFLEANPDVVEGMVAATTRSFEAAMEDPEGAVQAMLDAVSNQAPPEEVIAEQLEMTTGLLHTEATEGMPPGANAEEDWQNTIDLFAEYGGLEDPGAPADYWDGSFAPAAAQ